MHCGVSQLLEVLRQRNYVFELVLTNLLTTVNMR